MKKSNYTLKFTSSELKWILNALEKKANSLEAEIEEIYKDGFIEDSQIAQITNLQLSNINSIITKIEDIPF